MRSEYAHWGKVVRAGAICAQFRGGPLLDFGHALLSVKPDLVQLDASAEVRRWCPSNWSISPLDVSENWSYEQQLIVFCEIHYHLFVLQNQLKETQKTFQQRIQQREKDLQQLREAVESQKVSLEKKRSLSQSQFRLTEAWITVCLNSALHRQQWRTVKGPLLSSSAHPLKDAALSWYSWSEIKKRLQWVKLKDDWSRRSMIWGGETLSWSSFHTHRITSSSCRYHRSRIIFLSSFFWKIYLAVKHHTP